MMKKRALGCALLLQFSLTAVAQPPAPPPTPKGPLLSQPVVDSLRGGRMTMNYENIDLKVLARLMSELTGRNILLDDRVQGKVTVLSSREVSADEAFQLFRAALDRYGFQIQERQGFVLVMPSPDARRDGRLRVNPRNLKGDENTVGLILTRNGDAAMLQQALRPLISDPNNIQAVAAGRALIVVDKASVVAKAAEIARRLDKAIPTTKVAVLIPKYAEAEKLAPVLTQSLTRQGQLPGDAQPPRVSAFAPTNAVIVQGTEHQLAEARRIVERLDIPRAAPDEIEKAQFYVHFLQYAPAEETAKILGNMLSEKKTQQQLQQGLDPLQLLSNSAGSASSGAVKTAPVALDGSQGYPRLTSGQDNQKLAYVSAKVASDLETNSIILFLPPSEYAEVKELISELDVPRKQVLVLAMVAEVSLSKVLEAGARLQVASPDGLLSTYRAGFTEEGLLSALSGGNFAVGVVNGNSQTINVNGRDVRVPTFFSFLQGNQVNTDFNLLSSPRLLTSDHKEAEMKVGNVVPFPTGARFDNFGQPLVTYDYKDVGINLKFTPHISQSDTIRIDLDQQIQEVTEYLRQNLGGTGYDVPLISNRSVKTFVTVKEGETLLIGGLIAKRTVETISKVPLLGDIPLLENLFKESRKEDRKTTLFVALTPYIIQHPDEIARLDRPYQEFIKGDPTPRDAQHEPRNTQASKHAVPDPYGGAKAVVPPAGAIRLRDFTIRPPEGPDNLRAARLHVTNTFGQAVEFVLVGQIRQPNGETRQITSAPLRLNAGEQREVTLPPYQFPDLTGNYDFDVRALVGEEVVARLPLNARVEVKSLSPAPGGSRQIR